MPSDMPSMDDAGTCASCGQRTSCGSPQPSGGPFHCCHCWGTNDTMDGVSPVVHRWWAGAEHTAWVSRACASLPVQSMSIRMSDTKSEDVSFVVDRSNHYFSGVGANKVWPATQRLCAYLEAAFLEKGLQPPGSAIEIGAGCGVAGIILARRGWRVTLTDLPWILPLVEANVEANLSTSRGEQARDGQQEQRPLVAALRWGHRVDADALVGPSAEAAPDIVYGADICYFEEDHAALLETLEHLQAPHNVIAIQHRQGCQLSFAAAARQRGWLVAEATVEKELYGFAVTHRFCCDRCSVLLLNRPPTQQMPTVAAREPAAATTAADRERGAVAATAPVAEQLVDTFCSYDACGLLVLKKGDSRGRAATTSWHWRSALPRPEPESGCP